MAPQTAWFTGDGHTQTFNLPAAAESLDGGYWNGLLQPPANFILGPSGTSVTVAFVPMSGDTIAIVFEAAGVSPTPPGPPTPPPQPPTPSPCKQLLGDYVPNERNALGQTQILNLALGRIGARGQITDVNEGSPNAVKCLAIWDAIFQEVLIERDWKFAKIRVEIEQSLCGPLYGYRYAWALPSDFMRFVRPHKRPPDRSLYTWLCSPEGCGYYHRHDPPFWPLGYPYVVETLPVDGNKYVLTNYGGFMGPAKINYIRLISDYTQLMPGFVNCLAWRFAQELAVAVTEDLKKFQMAEQMYRDSLNSAEAQNETMDFISYDEAGSESWERAGRWRGVW